MMTLRKNWRELFFRFSAEFAIVVVGVTIALWADSWVSDRGDREQEFARLRALQDNLTETLDSLRMERKNASGGADALRELVTSQEIPGEELRQLVRFGVLYGPTFSPELNVYDDLKNSGELALLTNRNIRRSLATMDNRLEVLQLAQSDLALVQQLEIDSYAIDHINLRVLYGDDLGISWVTPDMEHDFNFLSDMRFKNRVLLKLDLVTQLVSGFDKAEAALESVRQSIDLQLSNQQD